MDQTHMQLLKNVVSKWSSASLGTNSYIDKDDLTQECWAKVVEVLPLPKYRDLPEDDLKRIFNTILGNKIRDISKKSQIRPDASKLHPTVLNDIINDSLYDAFGSLNYTICVDLGEDQEKLFRLERLKHEIMEFAGTQNPRLLQFYNILIDPPQDILDRWEKMKEESTCYRAFDYIPPYTVGKMLGIESRIVKKALNRLYKYLLNTGYDMGSICPKKSASMGGVMDSNYIFCRDRQQRVHKKICEHNKAIGVSSCKNCLNEMGDLMPVPKKGKAKLIASLVHKVLLENGKPMEVDDIVSGIKIAYKYNVSSGMIIGCLSGDVNFVKIDKSYTVAELQAEKEMSGKSGIAVSKVVKVKNDGKVTSFSLICNVMQQNNNKPMHINDISATIKSTLGHDVSVNSIIASIGAHRSKFTKCDTGVFRLNL